MLAQMIRSYDDLGLDPVALAAQPYEGTRILSPLTAGEEYSPTWDIDKAYDQALEKSAMVARCTYGPAQKAASVPLRVWERQSGQTKGQPVGDHELDVVLNNPSSDPVMGSRDELVTRTFLHHHLAGTSLTGIVRGRDPRRGRSTMVTGLVAEDPREVYPVPSPELLLAQWNYCDGNGQRRAWKREDLAAWRRHDPRNRLWGISVLKSLALTVDSAVQTAETQLRRAAMDGMPGMILSDESITGRPDAIIQERAMNARQRSRRGGIMLLGAKEKLVASGMSNSDLGLLASMAFDRDMIATAFGFLPSGFSNDSLTYSNAAIFVLHEWSLVQETLGRWTDLLTSFLFSREDQRKFYIAADYSDVQALQDINSEKLKTLADASHKGLSVKTLARTLDLPIPADELSDEVLVPGTLQREESVNVTA